MELISQSYFLICLAASDFGVLADLDWGKGERVNQKRGIETLTGERVKHKRAVRKLFIISVEIMKLDRFSRFLRLDPILYEFDRV